MKKMQFVFMFVLAVLVSYNVQAQKNEKKGKEKKGNAVGNQAAIIKTSAQCEMCKDKIEGTVRALDGVKTAELNLESKELRVSFNSNKIQADAIRVAVTKAGYEADGMDADKEAYKDLPRCCKK